MYIYIYTYRHIYLVSDCGSWHGLAGSLGRGARWILDSLAGGSATTILAPRGVYMRLSVCLFVCGMYVEFDLVATARLCRCGVVVTLYVPVA